ncbi:hypothetical protein BJX68DRAFT_270961 [Aspergillus pseudodeflectus]|uniref:Hydrophobic surface binding protein A-domain-containing protein n=1 Tax=Aspergillus pseudodeflectus TaxID=176178 RepID=A0ABR4JP15_9EURO
MKLATTLVTITFLIPTILTSPTLNPKRSLPDYLAVITSLTDATNDFSSWITEYASGTITGPDLLTHSTDLLDAYAGLSGTIIQLDPLSNSDALGLLNPVLGLRDATGDMVDTLITVKSSLVGDGLNDEISVWLSELKGEMEYLRDRIVDKVLAALKEAVYDVLNSIPEQIGRGEDALLT